MRRQSPPVSRNTHSLKIGTFAAPAIVLIQVCLFSLGAVCQTAAPAAAPVTPAQYRAKILALQELVCSPDAIAKSVVDGLQGTMKAYAAELNKLIQGKIDALHKAPPGGLDDDDIKLLIGKAEKDQERVSKLLKDDFDGYCKDPLSPASSAQTVNTAVATQSDLPYVTISPSVLDFGTQSLGQESEAKEVTVTNRADEKLTLQPMKLLSTPDASSFKIVDDKCTSPIAEKGGQCTFKVTFKPTRVEVASNGAVTRTNQSFVIPLKAGSSLPTVIQDELKSVPDSAKVADVLRHPADHAAEVKILQNLDNTIQQSQFPKLVVRGEPEHWSYPFSRMVIGADFFAATSRDVQQKFFMDFNLTAPFGPKDHTDPLEHRLWLFLNPRITSVPANPSSPLSELNIDALSTKFAGNPSQIVQGFEFVGGTEVALLKPRQGISWWTGAYANTKARLSVSWVTGFGASTPLSIKNQGTETVKNNSSITGEFCPNGVSDPDRPFCAKLLDTAGNPISSVNVNLFLKERSRFFYKFYTGLRFKTHFFSPNVEGECDTIDAEHPCEAPYDVFPGVIDITAAKDAAITGGKLSKWLFRVDAVYPLPIYKSIYVFGSTYLGFGKNRETIPLVVEDGNTDPTDTVRIPVPLLDRDFYRIGIGFDFLGLLKKKAQPPNK